MLLTPVNLFLQRQTTLKNTAKSANQTSVTAPMPYDSVSFGKKLSNEETTAIFNNYNPVVKDFDSYHVPVHNKDIARRLQKSYTEKSFHDLFKYVKKHGTFDINLDPETKFVQTSIIDKKENPLMSKLVWVTDTSNFMPLLKDTNPDLCVPLMENISGYYAKQQSSFDKIINNPLLFELNHDWPNTAKNGVGHVFNPENKITHKWYPRTRLDSIGLYLGTMSDLIKDGLQGSKYGYKKAADISQNAIESIANTTAYLNKIVYPYAKDTGPWEEKTFNSTASSDVAIINDAFRKVIDLMYSPTKDKELLKVRTRLLNAKNGSIFKDEQGLRNMLKIGEHRIKTNSAWEFPTQRKRDGAMSFIFKTEKLDEDVINNAIKVFARLKKFEKPTPKNKELVRDNGILRYTGDNYLYINADLDFEKNVYIPKRKFPDRTEAQWFMVSDMSKAYGMIAKSLMDYIAKGGKSNAAKNLLQYAMQKETEYINRSYARITGKNSYKANAKPCPAFKVPEAYQAVTDAKGKIKFVPGTHTPLTWAQASLYDASKLFEQNLKRYPEIIKS